MPISLLHTLVQTYHDAFIVDNQTKERLIEEDPRSADILKPVLKGKDIQYYRAKWAGLWLIDTHNGYGDVSPINIDDYKAIKKHLNKFYTRLERRQDKGITPYNLRNCAYYAEFEKEKIVYSEIVQHPQFFFDSEGMYYPEATSFLITGKHLKLLVGIFHSTAFTFFFKNYYSGGGLGESGYRYKKAFIEKTPVPIVTKKNHRLIQRIEILVERILINQQKLKNTLMEESEIEKIVYQLYGLTEKEIQLVENGE